MRGVSRLASFINKARHLIGLYYAGTE